MIIDMTDRRKKFPDVFMKAKIQIKNKPETASERGVEIIVEKNVKKWNKVENNS